MTFAIITGTSRGLGFSIARLFLQSGIHVIGISRQKNDQLTKIALDNNVNYFHFTCDVGDVDALNTTIQAIDQKMAALEVTKLYVINNAATLNPIEQASQIDSDTLTYHFQVNVVAPMTLMNHYLRVASDQDVPLYGVTITSGAAERPIYGWSAYCSSKASINMYTQAAALEQTALKTNHKIIAFSPGVMDTDMQCDIRKSDANAFQDVETFRKYKINNQLQDPETVGTVLVTILKNHETIQTGRIYNVHDFL